MKLSTPTSPLLGGPTGDKQPTASNNSNVTVMSAKEAEQYA